MLIKRLLVFISIILIILGVGVTLTSTSINLFIQNKKYHGIVNYLKNKKSKYKYVIEIPSINLKQGIGSDLNQDLVMANNNTIAGHSGYCKVCYFNKLDKLKIGDIVYFYKPDKEIYYVSNKYIYDKNKVVINNELNLVTCLKEDKNKRLVVGLTKN